MIGGLIVDPVVRKYLYELSNEEIRKHPLAYNNQLIKKLIQSKAVPNSAKRWLKIGLFFRLASGVLVVAFILSLVVYLFLPLLKKIY